MTTREETLKNTEIPCFGGIFPNLAVPNNEFVLRAKIWAKAAIWELQVDGSALVELMALLNP